MAEILKIFGIALVIFLVIDMIWLGFIARNFYREHLGFLMEKNVNWLAAIVFYLIFVAGLVFFVINPALTDNSFSYALLAGAFYGLITYATYDLTNLATLKGWPVIITLADLAWGTFLASATASISFWVIKLVNVV